LKILTAHPSPLLPFPLHSPPPFSVLPFITGSTLPYFPSRSLLPLKVGPSNPASRAGGAVSSPIRVWDGAPAKIELGAF